MSVLVQHLNADTTFLLTFSATPSPRAPSPCRAAEARPGPRHALPSPPLSPSSPLTTTGAPSFSILLDPWLTGACQVYHPRFAISRHTVAPSVSSLRQLAAAPDLVIISQAKADHCHAETLRQLPGSGSPTVVLADPGAAKIIRKWKHFRPAHEKVQAMARYDPARGHDTIRRFKVAAVDAGHEAGEVTVAFLRSRWSLTGVHTAVGITYRAPRARASPSSSSPPVSHNHHHQALPLTPPDTPHTPHPPSPSSSTDPSPSRSPPKTISIIYSPHGVPFSLLEPYATQHLAAHDALPLTLLLHSFDRVQNVRWLGGTISNGVPGGVEIAARLQARCWVSAHDEEKAVAGFSTRSVTTRKFGCREARDRVRERQSALRRMEAEEKQDVATHEPARPPPPLGPDTDANVDVDVDEDVDETTTTTATIVLDAGAAIQLDAQNAAGPSALTTDDRTSIRTQAGKRPPSTNGQKDSSTFPTR